jgi:hypothetical protein
MDDTDLSALRTRLAALEKEVKALRQELAALRKQSLAQPGPIPGLLTGDPEPYGLSVPAGQPDLPVASQPPKTAAEPVAKSKKPSPSRRSPRSR